MELTNDFEVAVPVERAWAVLTDLERIAPCLPGAQLREVQGDEYRGSVKIKVGPITTSYDGVIRISELDVAMHRAVLSAEGRETRGQGNVASVITATLTATSVGTKVAVVTDLTITGKVAQFGRGVLADVSAKLLDQFVENLETTVLILDGEPPQDGEEIEHDAAHSVGEGPSDSNGEVRQIDSEPSEPVDLVGLAGGSLARRMLKPLMIVGFGLAAVLHLARRRRD